MTDKITKEDLKKVTRFEVINHAYNLEDVGRLITFYKNEKYKDFNNIEFQLQDNGETLKIFING